MSGKEKAEEEKGEGSGRREWKWGKEERRKKRIREGRERKGRGKWNMEELCKHLLPPPRSQFSTHINSVKALEEDPVACKNSRWPQGCREVTLWTESHYVTSRLQGKYAKGWVNTVQMLPERGWASSSPGSGEQMERLLSTGRGPSTEVGRNMMWPGVEIFS